MPVGNGDISNYERWNPKSTPQIKTPTSIYNLRKFQLVRFTGQLGNLNAERISTQHT